MAWLVAIPVLVMQTHLSLSVWAALLTLGSMLFLPSSPWWGKQIARLGSKPVVLWALGGYGASFMLLGLGCCCWPRMRSRVTSDWAY